MHVFTVSKVALRDAVKRPTKRLSSWELLDLTEQKRTFKAELAPQGTEAKKQQQEVACERWWDPGAVMVTEGNNSREAPKHGTSSPTRSFGLGRGR
jgi:hypothetical protein